MSEITFTEDELAEFNARTWDQDSRNQVTRISGRLGIRELIQRHGRAKCDAMWAEIKRREYKKVPAARQIRGS